MAIFGCLRLRSRRKTDSCCISGGLKRMTMEEVQKLTMNFSRSRVIAFGGFSTVYLGEFPDSRLGAIKIIDCSSKRLHTIYKQELEILQKIQHANIVQLVGYCENGKEQEEELGVLAFEYVPNGTLQENLQANNKNCSVLPWKNRMGIAFQLARALEYLHEECNPHIVHGDIKSSNILLDLDLNCKLCDYGSAKLGFSSFVQPTLSSARTMLGSPGYTDPHYLRTGIATKKSDIYSFGVVLLELITGLEAISLEGDVRLISRAGPMLKDECKVAKMVDPRLGAAVGGYDLGEAKVLASIAGLCLCDSPSLRPTASDILEIMRSRVPSISFLMFSLDKEI